LVETKEILTGDILIICDDINLDFGQVRIRAQGGDGGHNGLSSVIHYLGTDEFARLRLGVGMPPQGIDSADYVLEEFAEKEKKDLKLFIQEDTDCCLMWLEGNMTKAMEQHNRRKEYGKDGNN